MNIVKFQDIITDSEFFNEKLKGKYALAVNFLYVFPLGLEGLTDNVSSIVALEYSQIHEMPIEELNFTIDTETFHLERGSDYVLFNEFQEYVDNIGEIDKYIYLNEFATDSDITLDELKRFRTWLAEILDANDLWIQDWAKDPDKVHSMLNYYKMEMYDDVVKTLTQFNSYVDLSSITKQSGCGCGNQAIVWTADTIGVCDPLLIYRHNIYKYMIEIFSDITYWTGQVEICTEMKKYIDGILKANLPLASVTLYNKFADCTCMNLDNDEQTTMANILRRLSQSLGYIIEDKVSGNRNFISTAFLDWSTYLYEKMRW